MKQSVAGCKYRWLLPPLVEHEQVVALTRGLSLSLPLVELLVRRGFTSPQALEAFFNLDRERLVAHPSLLKDAQKVVDRLLLAIAKGEKILIAGDYDVDGMTGTSLLMAALLPLGARANFFLPHRVRDGYGLSVKTVERAAASGYSLIVTVDNGTTAFDAALVAKSRGVDLVITDHHRPHDALPEAFALVNPWQSDCQYPYKELSGVGVAFKVMALLYEKLNKPLPEGVYELLALGTVADVMPLTGENRFWVRQGLHRMNSNGSMALQTLRNNARLNRPVTALDIGFFLAPQLNALGRLDDPRAAVSFLIGGDAGETERIGRILADLNQSRKAIEGKVVADVEADIAAGKLDPKAEKMIVASRNSWSPGVIGLAASRLVSAYSCPVLLFHDAGGGVLKGSGRSIPAFNLFEALKESADLLLHFGGHAAAAGLALYAENVPELKRRFAKKIAAELTEEDFVQQIVCDAQISMTDVTKKFCTDLAFMEPFGVGNEKPVFYLPRVSVLDKPVIYKDAHVRCTLFAEGVVKPIIFFNRPDLFKVISEAGERNIDCAVQLLESEWEGKTRVELQGLDVAIS